MYSLLLLCNHYDNYIVYCLLLQGAISCAIDWNLLEHQFKLNYNYKNEVVNIYNEVNKFKVINYSNSKCFLPPFSIGSHIQNFSILGSCVVYYLH